jgi:hypothetical protein
MFRIRKDRAPSEPSRESQSRLPLRWAVILAIATITSLAADRVGGLPSAVGTFFAAAWALDVMIS